MARRAAEKYFTAAGDEAAGGTALGYLKSLSSAEQLRAARRILTAGAASVIVRGVPLTITKSVISWAAKKAGRILGAFTLILLVSAALTLLAPAIESAQDEDGANGGGG